MDQKFSSSISTETLPCGDSAGDRAELHLEKAVGLFASLKTESVCPGLVCPLLQKVARTRAGQRKSVHIVGGKRRDGHKRIKKRKRKRKKTLT